MWQNVTEPFNQAERRSVCLFALNTATTLLPSLRLKFFRVEPERSSDETSDFFFFVSQIRGQQSVSFPKSEMKRS